MSSVRGLLTGPGRGWAVAATAPIIVMVAAALGGHGWLVAIAALASLVADFLVHQRSKEAQRILRGAGLGLLTRTTLRLMAVALLGAQLWTSPSTGVAYGVSGLALVAALAVCNSLRTRYRTVSRSVVEARNAGLPEAPAVPEWQVSGQGWWRLLPEVPLLVGSALAVTSPAGTIAAGLASVLLAATQAAVLLRAGERAARVLDPGEVLARAQEFIHHARPEVILYFSGPAPSAYQVNTWLSTMERLRRPSLVLLRERSVFAALGPTDLPVLCVPSPTDLMGLEFPDARVALYPANVGNNIHLLRQPTIMSAFIGHGDSDKNASFNPFARVYDEIWVAGRAGADRYWRAEIGVEESQLVFVGRPQIDAVSSKVSDRRDRIPTVLYAPTWEGWDVAQAYSSLVAIGRALLDRVLAHPGEVRLVYKPHPFTGIRDPAFRAAHEAIVAVVSAANTGRGHLSPLLADASIAPGTEPAPRSALEAEARRQQHEQRFWESVPRDAHLVVGPDGPSLYSCFNEADVLVTDISSVVTDFLASGRPYAVCNTTGLEAGEFATRFPSAGAAVVIGGDGSGLDEIIAAAMEPTTDRLATQRRVLADYLVGSSATSGMARFAAAVDALASKSQARNDRRSPDVDQSRDPSAAAILPGEEVTALEPAQPSWGRDQEGEAVEAEGGED